MIYNVLDVCRYIINYSNEKGYEISNLKLQKLLYFVQGCFLIEKNEPCFNDPIEAWEFGPVVSEAYQEYKMYGASNIPPITKYFHIDKENWLNSGYVKYQDNVISNEDKKIIEQVVDSLSSATALDLVRTTHEQTPWKDAYVAGKNSIISLDDIKKYFKKYEKH